MEVKIDKFENPVDSHTDVVRRDDIDLIYTVEQDNLDIMDGDYIDGGDDNNVGIEKSVKDNEVRRFKNLLLLWYFFRARLNFIWNYLLGGIISRYPGLVIVFIKNGGLLASKCFVGWRDNDGNGLIHYGASEHNLELVRVAHDLGCDYGFFNDEGKNELHLFFENLIYEKDIERGLGGWVKFISATVMRRVFDFLYGANIDYRNKKVLKSLGLGDKTKTGSFEDNTKVDDLIEENGIDEIEDENRGKNEYQINNKDKTSRNREEHVVENNLGGLEINESKNNGDVLVGYNTSYNDTGLVDRDRHGNSNNSENIQKRKILKKGILLGEGVSAIFHDIKTRVVDYRLSLHAWLIDLSDVEVEYGFSCNEELMIYLVDTLKMDISVEYGQVQGLSKEYRKWRDGGNWGDVIKNDSSYKGVSRSGKGNKGGSGSDNGDSNGYKNTDSNSSWKNIDLAGFSIRNILGTSIEVVMLNYWLFLNEVGSGVTQEDDERYRSVIKFLISRGAKINEVNRSYGYEDSVRDAMQESVIRVLCPYFVRFLKKPEHILVLRDIVMDGGFDLRKPLADGNTFLHFLVFKYKKEGTGVMSRSMENDFLMDSGLLQNQLKSGMELGRLNEFMRVNVDRFVADCESQLSQRRVLKISKFNRMVYELLDEASQRIDEYIGESVKSSDEGDDEYSGELMKVKEQEEKQKVRCERELAIFRSMGQQRNGFWLSDDLETFKKSIGGQLDGFKKSQEVFLKKEVFNELSIDIGVDKNTNTSSQADKGINKGIGLSAIVVDLYNGVLDLRGVAQAELEDGEAYVQASMKTHVEFFNTLDVRILEIILLYLIEAGNLSLDDFYIKNRNGDIPIDYLNRNSFLTKKVLLDWVKNTVLEVDLRKKLSGKFRDDVSGQNNKDDNMNRGESINGVYSTRRKI